MKTILLWLAIVSVVWGAPTPVPSLPAELYLPDGRVLKNATITKMTTENVTIKHAGGYATLRYEFFPPSVRPSLEKVRPGGSKLPPGDTAAEQQVVDGQVFIPTAGMGPYKFGNVPVYAFDESVALIWTTTPTGTVKLPPPMAEAVTDADGKFHLTVPKGKPFILFAQGFRYIGEGKNELLEWHVPSGEIKHFNQVNLSNEWRHRHRPVEIEKRD